MPEIMQLLTCTRCNSVWARPVERGRRPRLCPDCQAHSAKGIPRARTPDSVPDRRSHNRIDENTPGYQLAAQSTTYLAAIVLAHQALRNGQYRLAEKTLAEVIPDGDHRVQVVGLPKD